MLWSERLLKRVLIDLGLIKIYNKLIYDKLYTNLTNIYIKYLHRDLNKINLLSV